MALNNIDRDTLERIRTIAKFLHEHETDILDLKVQVDTPTTGLKDRMDALVDDGEDYLDEIGWTELTPAEFFDITYIVTALVGDAIANGRAALAATRKM